MFATVSSSAAMADHPTIERASTSPKAMIFLAPKEEAGREAVERALADELGTLADRHPDLRIEAAVRLPEETIGEMWEMIADASASDIYQPTDIPDSPYVGVLVVTGPPGSAPEVFASLHGLGERLAHVCDPDTSLAAAGTSDTMIPVEDSWLYLMLLRRREGDTVRHFHDYWRIQHPRFTMRIAGLSGYRQDHIVEGYSRELARTSGVAEFDVDGVVEAFATGVDGFADQWRWEMANQVPDDEVEFMDIARCSIGYYRWLGPGPSAAAAGNAGAQQTTMRVKALLFLASSGEGAELIDAAAEEAERMATSHPELECMSLPGLTDAELEQLWTATADLRLAGVSGTTFEPEEYRVEDYPRAPYAVVLSLAAPPGSIDALIDAARGLSIRFRPCLDPTASAAVVGTEETMLGGTGAIVYFNNVRRPATQSIEDFHSYWRLEHTKLSTRIQKLRGYRQIHAVDDASFRLARAAGLEVFDFDGTAEGHAHSIDDLVHQWRWEVANKLYEDEARFTDVGRCVMGYFSVPS